MVQGAKTQYVAVSGYMSGGRPSRLQSRTLLNHNHVLTRFLWTRRSVKLLPM